MNLNKNGMEEQGIEIHVRAVTRRKEKITQRNRGKEEKKRPTETETRNEGKKE